jgi:hypothetical protein
MEGMARMECEKENRKEGNGKKEMEKIKLPQVE